MKSYKLYIFDFDDTLLLTFQKVINLYYPLLAQRLGLVYQGEEVVKQNWGGHLDSALPQIFKGEATVHEIMEMLRILHIEHPAEAATGATRILKILKKHDKSLVIATSGDLEMVKSGVRTGLNLQPEFFDFIYSTSIYDTQKPSPDIIPTIQAIVTNRKHQDISIQDIVYIGDSLADYETAQSCGVDFYAITTGIHRLEDFLNAGLPQSNIFPGLSHAMTPDTQHGIVALIQNEAQEYLLVQEGRKHSPFYGAWSGPHGRCQPEDVLEEETVVREVIEECAFLVKPVRKVYERPADTKIKTVAFWECKPLQPVSEAKINDNIEISDLRWCSLEEIKSSKLRLYDGTKDYFYNHILLTKLPSNHDE